MGRPVLLELENTTQCTDMSSKISFLPVLAILVALLINDMVDCSAIDTDTTVNLNEVCTEECANLINHGECYNMRLTPDGNGGGECEVFCAVVDPDTNEIVTRVWEPCKYWNIE